MLNLRGKVDNPDVAAWLATPRKMRDVIWRHIEDATYLEDVVAAQKYDGILFIESTTPSRPTANAQKTIAARAGL